MINFLNNDLTSIVAIVALAVLTGIGSVAPDVAVPLIVGLTGIHINTVRNTTPTTTTSAPAQPKNPMGT